MNKFKGPDKGRCLECLKNKKGGDVASKQYPNRKTKLSQLANGEPNMSILLQIMLNILECFEQRSDII